MDKIALVTGSTNNVGKGIAEILSKDGFLVIVTSRHKKHPLDTPQLAGGRKADFAEGE